VDDAQHSGIEKELRSEAGQIKRHRQEMTVKPTVRLFAMDSQILKEHRPEGSAACLD
jgi:hypothetical protein